MKYRLIQVRLILPCLLWVIQLTVFSQDLTIIKEVELNNPIAVSMDRQGSIFVALKRGSIIKISGEGKIELEYSPEKNLAISLIESWTTLDILLFQEGIQTLTLLNRFLTPISTIELSDHIGYARLATFNYGSNIWVIDDSDFSLKLFDPTLNQTVVNTPLNLILSEDSYQFSFIREYQNQVYISDLNNGILIFDNLGNYLRTLDVRGVSFFGFLENEIYFKKADQLVFMDVYSDQQRSFTVPDALFYLVSEEKLFLFTKERMTIYSY